MFLPKEIEETLGKNFLFPSKPLFGTVATVNHLGPNVRTMRIYDFDDLGSPILLTHKHSLKWKEFLNNTQIAICLVSDDKLTQVIVKGALRFDQTFEQIHSYWSVVREDVKKLYDPAYSVESPFTEPLETSILKETPAAFGMVRLIPSFWELLSLQTNAYLQSQRYHFHFSNGGWEKKRMNLG